MSPYGLILGISIIIGINFFSKKNTTISKNKLNLFIIGTIISAIIGARAYHIIDQWSFYSKNLWQIPATWNGGLGIFGGILGALFFIFIFSLIFKISFFSITNSITPVIPLCQAIGRFGNFVNKEISSWWIETCLNLVLFFLLKKSKNPTAHYLIGYGVIRFFIEFLRSDTWQVNNFKVAQVISLIFLVIGILILKNQKTSS